jgi:hypothetical protein
MCASMTSCTKCSYSATEHARLFGLLQFVDPPLPKIKRAFRQGLPFWQTIVARIEAQVQYSWDLQKLNAEELAVLEKLYEKAYVPPDEEEEIDINLWYKKIAGLRKEHAKKGSRKLYPQ